MQPKHTSRIKSSGDPWRGRRQALILFTGATGQIGSALLDEMLRQDPSAAFVVLLRTSRGVSLEDRFSGCATPLMMRARASGRIQLIQGDIRSPALGLEGALSAFLVRSVREVVHCASACRFDTKENSVFQTNVRGTEHLLQFCAEARRARGEKIVFTHLSSAYACGRTSGTVFPDQLDVDGVFRNGYEQSKAEAEQAVRRCEHVRATIFRPSIVSGDTRTGRIPAQHLLSRMTRLVLAGALDLQSINPYVPLDIIPVDYAASAICELRKRSAGRGESYHVTSGIGRETTPAQFLQLFRRTVPLQMLPRSNLRIRGVSKRSSRLEPVREYLVENPRFVADATVRWVAPPPAFREYAYQHFVHCCGATQPRA